MVKKVNLSKSTMRIKTLKRVPKLFFAKITRLFCILKINASTFLHFTRFFMTPYEKKESRETDRMNEFEELSKKEVSIDIKVIFRKKNQFFDLKFEYREFPSMKILGSCKIYDSAILITNVEYIFLKS
jgi:hypothetical protein